MSPPKRRPEDAAALRASLVDHARELVGRDGAAALTMRALADEAGCAVGLPYKVFADRRDLVAELCHAEFVRLGSAFDELARRADEGSGTVAGNLVWFAELLLDSPAVALIGEIVGDAELAGTIADRVHRTGEGPASFEVVVARYLAAERSAGRVAEDVDEEAVAFFVAGAVHNLIVSGEAWPRPSRPRLEDHLTALSRLLTPPPTP